MKRVGSKWASAAVASCMAMATVGPVAVAPRDAAAADSTRALPLLVKRGKKKNKAPKDAMDPAAANERRVPVQQVAQQMLDAGEPAEAAREFDRGAAVHGDPVLYLDAGDAWLAAAKDEGDAEMAAAAAERGRIALDILYFHLDSGADPYFKLVEATEIPGLINRAEDLIEAAEAAADELDVAAAPAAAPAKPKAKGDGKLMVISGIAVGSVGGALLVMGVAGLAIGAVNQSRANRDTVYGSEYDEVERKGRRGNILAGVGLGVGAVLVGGGVALYLLGKKRQKAAANDDKVVTVTPTLNGLAVAGRF